jgi:hypothetical protein
MKPKHRSKPKTKWEKEPQGYRRDDAYYQLSRQEQVMIFRLHTDHNRLRHHIFC